MNQRSEKLKCLTILIRLKKVRQVNGKFYRVFAIGRDMTATRILENYKQHGLNTHYYR